MRNVSTAMIGEQGAKKMADRSTRAPPSRFCSIPGARARAFDQTLRPG